MDVVTPSERSRRRSANNIKNGVRPTRGRHWMRLDSAAFDTFMAETGFTSNLEVANWLRVGEGTIYRLRAGQSAPGTELLAAFELNMPGGQWLKFFHVGRQDAA